jgi:hypothetical protein
MKHPRNAKPTSRVSKTIVGTEAEEIIRRFWSAPDDALFTRKEMAVVRRCSIAKLEREAWLQTGVPVLKDGAQALGRKRDVLAHLRVGAP